MRYWEIISEEGLVVPGVNTTPDVQPGEPKRQGAKMGFDLDDNGLPPVWTGLNSTTGAKDSPNKAKKGQTFYGKHGTPANKSAPVVESAKINLRERPLFLYHGTSTVFLDSILEDGIQGTSYWGTHEMAARFAGQNVRDHGGSPIMFIVSIDRFDNWLFGEDDNMIDFPVHDDFERRAELWKQSDKDWLASYNIYDAVTYGADLTVSANDLVR